MKRYLVLLLVTFGVQASVTTTTEIDLYKGSTKVGGPYSSMQLCTGAAIAKGSGNYLCKNERIRVKVDTGTTSPPIDPPAQLQTSLSWVAATDISSCTTTGYRLYRAQDAAATLMLADVPSTSLSYTDTNVVSGSTYHYQVMTVATCTDGTTSTPNVESIPASAQKVFP